MVDKRKWGLAPALLNGAVLLVLAIVLPESAGSALGQQPAHRPFTSTLSDTSTNRVLAIEPLKRSQAEAIGQLQQLGKITLPQAQSLAALSSTKFIEELAVRPLVGPSTIAAPKPGTSVPSPSVNWTADGGATTGDPGVALLLAKVGGDDRFIAHCTGTLIRQNIVLTASHCVCYFDNPADNYLTGSSCKNGHDLSPPSPLLDSSRWLVFFQHVGTRQVKSVEINKDYQFSDQAVRNDIALFVLSRPVDEIVSPSFPAPSDATPSWTAGTIVGFGYSANPSGGTATLLQQLVLPGLKARGSVSYASCASEQYLDPTATLCSLYGSAAGSSRATICGGDSGGPLWQATRLVTQIGVASGRSDQNCAQTGTLTFEMAVTHRAHWDWISQRLSQLGSAEAKGRWPVFGENLRFVLDRRNGQVFDDTGQYAADSWMVAPDAGPILATINSSGIVKHFELRSRAGKTLCSGVAGPSKNMPTVDYCWATIAPDQQFHVVAQGTPNEGFQFVVTSHLQGTSFAQ